VRAESKRARKCQPSAPPYGLEPKYKQKKKEKKEKERVCENYYCHCRHAPPFRPDPRSLAWERLANQDPVLSPPYRLILPRAALVHHFLCHSGDHSLGCFARVARTRPLKHPLSRAHKLPIERDLDCPRQPFYSIHVTLSKGRHESSNQTLPRH
jgi:hypothetical protein